MGGWVGGGLGRVKGETDEHRHCSRKEPSTSEFSVLLALPQDDGKVMAQEPGVHSRKSPQPCPSLFPHVELLWVCLWLISSFRSQL